MNIKQSFYLAARFLASRNTDKNLFRHIKGAILGIAISLIPLVIVLEVTDGMIAGITRRYIETGSYHFQARNYRENDPDFSLLAEEVGKIDFVKNAFTFIQENCLIYTQTGRTGVSIRGLPGDLFKRDEMLRQYITFEEGDFSLDSESILLSSTIAKKIGAKNGDEVKILTAYSQPGRPVILRPARFIVKGIFTTGYRELDEISVFIDYTRAASLFRGISSTYIGIKVDEPYKNINEKASVIRESLPPGFMVNSWYAMNYTLYKSLETTKKLLLFIMLLILCVASLNISSAMVMMVHSRRKEIAILKSIGLSRNSISMSFMITGFLIGLAGTFSGMTAGVFLSIHINTIIMAIERLLNLFMSAGYAMANFFTHSDYSYFRILGSGYYLDEIPVILDFTGLFTVTVFSIFLSCAASFLPSHRAGAIRPVEILQKN